jgi:flagellar motor switch protein FliN
MAETIEYEQFEGEGPVTPNGADPNSADLSRLSDIPMELSVEIGRTHMTVGETLDLRVGSVVALERLAGETADLLVNGSAIARGEVVVIEEQYGLRITEILDGQSDAASTFDDDASPDGEPSPSVPSTANGGGTDRDAAMDEPESGAAQAGEGDGDG